MIQTFRLAAIGSRRFLRFAVWIAATLCGPSILAKDPPTPTGTPVPAYASFDKLLIEFMSRCDCAAATAAISHNGKLVLSRGYGWRDAQELKRTLPDALLRIGGVTQAITAAAVRKLIRDGKLTNETKVFPYLKLKPLRYASIDPRLNDITIAQLLDHQAGWDVSSGFDPFLHPQDVEKALRTPRRPRPTDIVRYMLSEPLQYDPGTKKVFSNFGYCVLGRVVEKATGKPYFNYVKDEILRPLGVDDIRPGRHFATDRDSREVWYPVRDVPVEAMDSFAGLVATAPAICKFLDVYWANGQPRQPGDDEQWTFYGNIAGTTAIVRERSDGYNIAILLTVRRKEPLTEKDDQMLVQQIDDAIEKIAAAEAN